MHCIDFNGYMHKACQKPNYEDANNKAQNKLKNIDIKIKIQRINENKIQES